MSSPASDAASPRRAVVIGASMAGLLAARVLADHFDEVVLLERDQLPTRPAPRKGTPHAVHPHGLLARGCAVLEALFPGFVEALVQRGALLGDIHRDIEFCVAGRPLAAGTAGQPGLCASRLMIEHEVRRRVLSRPGVRCLERVSVLEPVHDAALARVTGVRFRDAGEEGPSRVIGAALTVDCSGRGSRSPAWLADWGYEPPPEEKVEIGICYVSAYFERTGELDVGKGVMPVAIIGATADSPRPGVLIAQEPDAEGRARWVVGVGGYSGDHPESTLAGLRERTRALGSESLRRVAFEGTPIGPVLRYQIPVSVRRRYERLARFPQGFLLLGDAMTTFNPIYGQGMTVAAIEAEALARELARGGAAARTLARRYFKAAARAVDVPWQLATGGDLGIAAVPGPRPLPVRLLNRYVGRLQRAAMRDATVSLAFHRVLHMLAMPPSLFAPAVLWRVWRHGGTVSRGDASGDGWRRRAVRAGH